MLGGWLSDVVGKLATHADNVTPSLRKTHVIAVGTLGLIGGAVFVLLAAVSVLVLRQPFQSTDYGTGFAAILTALAANVMALAKAMQWGGQPEAMKPADSAGGD